VFSTSTISKTTVGPSPSMHAISPSSTASSTFKCSAIQVARSANPRNTFPLREINSPLFSETCANARNPSIFNSYRYSSESKGSGRRESRVAYVLNHDKNYSGWLRLRAERVKCSDES